ncbi:MAG: hypothetical protein NC935_07505 [Candidatus Omnitrophica bacterium]|nr:hypothetical protein [Candidatus Omnitrophota bacterium]
MKKNLPKFFVYIFLFIFYLSSTSFVHAQDISCIASGLASYIGNVFRDLQITPGSSVNSFGNVYFLSPVFNMTSPYFSSFVNEFNQELNNQGYSFNNFYAIAGNAYNTSWGTIGQFVNIARTTPIGQKGIILTEIGWYPHNTSNREAAVNQLQQEVAKFPIENVLGGLIFDVFGNNPQFAAQSLTESEINFICSANCFQARVGANSASYYSSSDESFYNKAEENAMRYTLEIAQNNISTLIPGINSAHNKGITPIIRLGTGNISGGFDNPEDLVFFIQNLNHQLNKAVYLILGPNEPLSECWATPECECGSEFELPVNVLSDNSPVRSNWVVKGSRSEDQPLTSPFPSSPSPNNPLQASSEMIQETSQGKIIYSQEKKPQLPALTKMTKNFVNAFWSLLPAQIAKNALLPSWETEAKVVTYAIPYIPDGQGNWTPDNNYQPACFDGEPQENEDVAKHIFPIPGEWSQLVGSLTGLAGMVLPHYLLNDSFLYQYFRYQMPKLDWRCVMWNHGPGVEANKESLGSPNNNLKPQIKVTLWAFIQRVLDTVESLLHIEEQKVVEIRENNELPAGNNAKKKAKEVVSAYSSKQVRQQFRSKGESQTLNSELTATVDLSNGLSQGGTYPYLFAGLDSVRRDACETLCWSTPKQWLEDGSQPWVGEGKICPSCDPKDYPFLPVNLPPPPQLPPYCEWIPAEGCKYYTCKYNTKEYSYTDPNNPCVGCGEGKSPFCEDTGDQYIYCNEFALHLPKDTNHCPHDTPGYNKACFDFGNDCEILIFPSSRIFYQNHPDLAALRGITQEYLLTLPENGPPYGPCFYANPNVAIQKGRWNNWDGCINLCNYACDGASRHYDY